MRSRSTAFRFVPFLLFATIATAPAPSDGAGFELTPIVSYRSGDYSCTGSTEVHVRAPACGVGVRSEAEDDEAFGMVLGFELSRGYAIEVLASRQETELDIEPLPGFIFLIPPADGDLSITHLQVGPARTWGGGKVQPVAGLAVGVSRVDADDPRQHHVRFEEDVLSASAGAGIKVLFSDRLGLRLEGRGYWVDLPEDVGGDFTQTDLGVGLILRF